MKKLFALLILFPLSAFAQSTYNYFPPPGMAYDGCCNLTLTPVTGTGFTLVTPTGTTTDGVNINTGAASTNGAGSINIKVGTSVANASHSGNCCTDVNIFAGSTNDPSTTHQSGNVTIHGGTDSNAAGGGNVTVAGGNAGPSATQKGGTVSNQAGSSVGTSGGGDVKALAGASATGSAGLITIQSGNSGTSGTAGYVQIIGGSAQGLTCTLAQCSGGDIRLTTGNSSSATHATDNAGSLQIFLGTSSAGTPGQVQISDNTAGVLDYLFDGNLRNFVATVQANTTGDTNGFLYLPAVAGVPTGVPANLTGNYANGSPSRYDTTDNRIYVYNGSWKDAGATPASITTAGTVTFTGLTTGTNADFLCLSAGGVVLLQASACTISSERFKHDVHLFTGDPLSELDRLQVKSFAIDEQYGTFCEPDHTEGTGHKKHLVKGACHQEGNRDPNATLVQIGLTAENVAAVEPRCSVWENDLKTPKSYRPECVTALLVSASQEFHRQSRRQFEFIYALLAVVGILVIHGTHLHLKMRRLVKA